MERGAGRAGSRGRDRDLVPRRGRSVLTPGCALTPVHERLRYADPAVGPREVGPVTGRGVVGVVAEVRVDQGADPEPVALAGTDPYVGGAACGAAADLGVVVG